VTGFADPALERLWRAAHARRERRGAAGDARITLPEITVEEAFARFGSLALPEVEVLPLLPLEEGSHLVPPRLREQRLPEARPPLERLAQER